jgi:hypothetical protein
MTTKTIDIWAKPDNIKNAKTEKLDVNKMKLKKSNKAYEVQPTSDEVYQAQVDYFMWYPGRHIIDDNKKDDGKRENKLQKIGFKKTQKKLKIYSFDGDNCVICLGDHKYGYMGKNFSCVQQPNNKPSACE